MDKSPTKTQNSHLQSITRQFQKIGGEFTSSPEQINRKLHDICAIIFDWDGVFNNGVKGEGIASYFSEVDSMGTNMLRFGFFLRNESSLATAVISGENNPTALHFASREHFQHIYLGIKDKRLALEHFCTTQQLKPSQILCIFDDINDLGMAEMCGLRCLINRSASPLFKQYVTDRKLCDYVTGNDSSHYAVREICELFLGIMNKFDRTIGSRVANDDSYLKYFHQRQQVQTLRFESSGGSIVPYNLNSD